MSNRVDLNKLLKDKSKDTYWAEAIADKVLETFPKAESYTCAAGISPSGIVHFGNFRDIVTSYAVHKSLKERGVNTKCIFSWDNFDRFRKVPANVPASYSQYIGMPLSSIPSPEEGYASYAEYFQKPFEQAMKELGIEIEYRSQTEEYKSGRYDKFIFLALNKRKEVARLLLSFMTDKGKEEAGINEEEYIENYYPISVYSEFTQKDATKVLSFDGKSTITYKCIETGKESTVDLSQTHIAKLAWKIDWPMRWMEESVVFEPGGHDHASPGGSFDTSSRVAKEIFGITEPVFAEYKFVGIQGLGAKMSGSKGNAISPLQLLDIYEPSLLKWLYFRKSPDQAFSLAFDTEIYRQYDEYDRETQADSNTNILKLCGYKQCEHPIPFKQAVALGQITQWNIEKVLDLVKDLGESYDSESVKTRLPKARNWLEKYNESEMIVLRNTINTDYVASMKEESVVEIKKLREELQKEYSSIEELEHLVYSIPKKEGLDQKENAPFQKTFFKHIYNLLISRDAGPRLSTFLWAVDRETILKLLNI